MLMEITIGGPAVTRTGHGDSQRHGHGGPRTRNELALAWWNLHQQQMRFRTAPPAGTTAARMANGGGARPTGQESESGTQNREGGVHVAQLIPVLGTICSRIASSVRLVVLNMRHPANPSSHTDQ